MHRLLNLQETVIADFGMLILQGALSSTCSTALYAELGCKDYACVMLYIVPSCDDHSSLPEGELLDACYAHFVNRAPRCIISTCSDPG